jgi:hypothetical protein
MQQRTETPELWAWQTKLLPFMMSILIALTIFSCAANVYQVYQVEKHIETTHDTDLKPMLVIPMTGKETVSERLLCVRWTTLATLESDAIERRYHQAGLILMTRVYIVFLGFTTGMVLSLIGATFILGKLRESQSSLQAEHTTLKFSLVSASPGLFLALLGTTLMLATIWARAEVVVKDRSLYVKQPLGMPELLETPANGAQLDDQLKKLRDEVNEELDKK